MKTYLMVGALALIAFAGVSKSSAAFADPNASINLCDERVKFETKVTWVKNQIGNASGYAFDKITATIGSAMWTELPANNTGTYEVTVGYPGIRGIYIFKVLAKENGNTSDCAITAVAAAR